MPFTFFSYDIAVILVFYFHLINQSFSTPAICHDLKKRKSKVFVKTFLVCGNIKLVKALRFCKIINVLNQFANAAFSSKGREGINKTNPWSKFCVWNVVVFSKGTKGNQLVTLSQQKDF